MEERMDIFKKVLKYLFAIASVVLVLSVAFPICYKLTRVEFFLYATLICIILDCINLVAISYIWEELVRLGKDDDKD